MRTLLSVCSKASDSLINMLRPIHNSGDIASDRPITILKPATVVLYCTV